MNIIRNAVLLVPTREEHAKLASFIEAYTDFKWNNNEKLSRFCASGDHKAYSLEGGRFLQGQISFYRTHRDSDYRLAVENGAFLITVDEYIARCLGWYDAESECEIDFGGVL